jgi:hypothetical protein
MQLLGRKNPPIEPEWNVEDSQVITDFRAPEMTKVKA